MTLPKNHPAWNSLLNLYPISPSLMVFTTEQARCCIIVIEICSASSFISFFVTDDSTPPSPLFALDWDGGAPCFAHRFGGKRPCPAVFLATSPLDSLACAPLLARSSAAAFTVFLLDPRSLKLCPLLSAVILGDVDKSIVDVTEDALWIPWHA